MLSRTTKLVANTTLQSSLLASSQYDSTSRTAVAAISANGWRTEVSGGDIQRDIATSSKPTRLRCTGTRRPQTRAASRTKLRIFGREVYFWMLLACLTLPEVVLLAPLFTTKQKLNLYNTYWAVVFPLAALQIPFAVLLTRNFIKGLPDELFESIRVDGAGPVRTFRHLVIPLTRPIAAAVIIFTLIAAWNDYLMPLVFMQATSMQTITLVPQFFVGEFNDDQTKILASAVVTAIPEIVAYLALQRLFERGLTAGAVK